MSILLGPEGSKELLLGNEAVARGAIEAGVNVVTAYPGTPSTEIVESLAEVAENLGIYVEWSANEKVAFEVAFAASISGLRSLTAMKHVGLNVAADIFMSTGYSGVVGGFVIVSADDPNCHSSQNEQDNRFYGLHGYVPVYEPSSPGEAKNLTRYLFEVSEKFHSPVLLRLTTRISHTRGVVEYGPVNRLKRKASFHKDKRRWVLLPVNARRLKREALQRMKKLQNFHENFPFNREWGEGELGIIASGVAYAHAVEAVGNLKVPVRFLKLSSVYPLPVKTIESFLNKVRQVLVVEEGDSFIENFVKALAPKDIPVHGKDLLPPYGELDTITVENAIRKLLRMKPKEPKKTVTVEEVPPRSPLLCPGCPHRATFYAVKMALRGKNVIYTGDIGCYTLGYNPPFEVIDTTLCMGASLGLASGLGKTVDDLIVAFIGDSTFFHTGLPALANIVYQQSPILTIVLDNSITAMTGFQPHPGTGFNAYWKPAKKISIEEVAKGLGVEYVKTLDPYDVKTFLREIRVAAEWVQKNKKPALIVAKRECALYALARLRRRKVKITTFQVDKDKCIKCMICVDYFACPAIFVKDGIPWIDPLLCTGCGVCERICPVNAISKAGKGVALYEI